MTIPDPFLPASAGVRCEPEASPSLESASPRATWFRLSDQIVIGTLHGLLLLAFGCYWGMQGGLTGRWIEFEQAPSPSFAYLVDINAAEWPELSQLPGIGQTLAQRIVETRTQHGPYRVYSDLLRVQGIGQKKLDAIKPYLQPLEQGGS